MQTEIRFLQELEADLESVVRVRDARAAKAERRTAIGRGVWAGAAAAVLAVSFALGSFVQGDGGRMVGDASSLVGVGAVPGPTAASGTRDGKTVSPPVAGADLGYPTTRAATKGEAAAGSADLPTSQHGPSSAAESQGPASDLSKIVRDGEMAVTIDQGSFAQHADDVVGIADANGGSVLSSTTTAGTSGSFTLRIPAKHFDDAMRQLAKLGSVDSSAVHGQDVTAQYIDQKAHLKIYLAHRKFLYGLLAKATTAGQALSYENQLSQVQLKIDQVTGQLRYLNNQVAESTIKLDLHEPGAEPVQQTTPIENPSLGDAISRGIQGFLNVIAVILIGFGYLVPVLVIAGIVYLAVRLVRRRHAVV
jgi:hypothetical protein